MRIESLATGILQCLFDILGIEARFRHELARNHLTHQRRTSAENTNVTNSRNGLNHVFDSQRLNFVSAHVDLVAPTSHKVATIANLLHLIAGWSPIHLRARVRGVLLGVEHRVHGADVKLARHEFELDAFV